jgi:hypothetical protein
MGASGADVKLSPLAQDLIPFQFECKNLAKIAVYQYYAQCRTHGTHEPVVVMKQNQSKPLVVIDAEVFLNIISKEQK